MSDAAPTIRPATADDRDRVEALLRANGLPTDDLPTADLRTGRDRLLVASVGGSVVGAGGLEIHGAHGLLRSVVVAESHRGRGLGSLLCEELEAVANEAGVETLALLTTTAAGFFGERGYERIDRDAVPGTIRETAEFAELCPASATCMVRDLA